MKSRFIAAFAALVLVISGCSNSQPSTNTPSTTPTPTATTITEVTNTEQTATQQYPITIKHAFGETVIESKPERVVTYGWANHDVALAIGVVPVGFSAANYGVQDNSGLLPWTKQALEELGELNPNVFQDTAGIDFEAISDAQPDVILAAYSGITAEEYETLSSIAPVVAYPEVPWVITWREQISMNAAGMGLVAEGEQLIKDVEALISETASKYDNIKGKSAVFTYLTPTDLSNFYIYSTSDTRGEFLLELGMTFPESVKPYFENVDGFTVQLSAENADALQDTDIIVAYGNQALLEALQADPIFSKIPAVINGSVVLIEDNTPLAAAGNPNPLSIAYTIEEYVQLISEAATKVK